MKMRSKMASESHFAPEVWRLIAIFLISASLSVFVSAQTSVFTYQGKLNDGGVAANGSYDMQFRLFDAVSAGNQVGSTLTISNVQATAGIFSTSLDFSAVAFSSGAERFLEISISPAGQNNFTVLAPRQRLTSAPYSIQAANAANLGGVAANQYVLTNDPRLDGSNYIQNTTAPQTGVNFNIGGTGTANVLNAATQFNLSGNRILSNAGTDNLFVGANVGASNTTGFSNVFLGNGTGRMNTIGRENTFVGFNAGVNNTEGNANSFFGNRAGEATTTGTSNSFYGWLTGMVNTTGFSNSFYGMTAGFSNTTGNGNSFFGTGAGTDNTTGFQNTFLGIGAGRFNTTGSNNIFIGRVSGVPNAATQVSNSVAIGVGATVSTSNTIVLGTSAQNTQIPGKLLMGGGTMMSGSFAAQSFSSGVFNGLFTGNLVMDGNALNNVLPSPVHLCIRTLSLGGGFGGEALTRCTTPFSISANKTDIEPFTGGIDVIKRLNPVIFKWKSGGGSDVGLNAEDVAEIAPQIVTRNEKGEIEDVKSGGLNLFFINAFKEQQAQIERQENQIRRQQQQIDALKKIICQMNAPAEMCKENRK